MPSPTFPFPEFTLDDFLPPVSHHLDEPKECSPLSTDLPEISSHSEHSQHLLSLPLHSSAPSTVSPASSKSPTLMIEPPSSHSPLSFESPSSPHSPSPVPSEFYPTSQGSASFSLTGSSPLPLSTSHPIQHHALKIRKPVRKGRERSQKARAARSKRDERISERQIAEDILSKNEAYMDGLERRLAALTSRVMAHVPSTQSTPQYVTPSRQKH